MHRKLLYVSMMVMMAAVVLGSGCARKKPKPSMTGTGTDQLGPVDDLSYAMGDRFGGEGEGVRITDVAFENVMFGYNEYQIGGSEGAKVEAVASYMQSNADVRLIAEGHCDERGSREYNVALGEHRAQAVRGYLISLGISGDRIQTRSYGEEQPLDAGHSESSWSLNRRVEFALYR